MPRKKAEWQGKTPDSRPPKSVLIRVFESTNGHCADPACGIKIGPKQWQADHTKRLEDGGENRESNLQPLCLACHAKKTGAENKRQAKADRVKAKAYGIKSNKKPVPGSKNSPWKRQWNKHTGRWETVRRDDA